MLSGSIKAKNVVIQGEGNVEDVSFGVAGDAVEMRVGNDAVMTMKDHVRFPADVGFDGQVVVANAGSIDGASIQLGDTVLSESDLKRILALLG
jgi:hypothetical protein